MVRRYNLSLSSRIYVFVLAICDIKISFHDVEWRISALGFKSLEAKCVLAGQGCNAQTQGSSFVDPTGKAKGGTVTGLLPDTPYDCYVVADPKIGKKDACSKPLRIITLASPPLVYHPALSTPNFGRKMLVGDTITTNRCIISSGGNFTRCIDAGTIDTYIVDGAVSPQKQWLAYAAYTSEGSQSFVLRNITTCALGLIGRIDNQTCITSYESPQGYDIVGTAFDPLGRRVWFALSQNTVRRSSPAAHRGSFEPLTGVDSGITMLQRLQSRKDQAITQATFSTMVASDDFFGTCEISTQGVFSGCTRSLGVEEALLVGPSRDARGFYALNTTAGNTLSFCGNDLSLPCSPVSGLPAGIEGYHLRFLTESVVYITGYNSTANMYVTTRCTVVDSTLFSNCQEVLMDLYHLMLLNAPANNGANAYILDVDFINQRVTNDVCDVEQDTGGFENCTILTSALPFSISSPVFSFPITFD